MPTRLTTRSGVRRPFTEQSLRSPLGWVPQAATMPSRGMGKPWRTFGSYATVYLLEGSGMYRDVRGVQQRVTAGDLMLVFPDVAHHYAADEPGWTELYLVFEGPVFDAWRSAGVLDDAKPVRRLEPIDHWRRRFEWVVSEATQGPPPSVEASMREVCRLQQVLAEALTPPHGGEGDWLARARELLSDERELPLPTVAGRLSMSYATLRRRFTEAMGMSPGRYRGSVVIDRACRLMAETDRSDKQIAAELGFCDEFHFSKRFKRITGRTPTQFRQALPGR